MDETYNIYATNDKGFCRRVKTHVGKQVAFRYANACDSKYSYQVVRND